MPTGGTRHAVTKNKNMQDVTLTERQALLCERALEIMENAGQWPAFKEDIRKFSGKAITDREYEALKNALRGES
jgi:predicted DNA binding protein